MKFDFSQAVKAKEGGKFLAPGIKDCVFKSVSFGNITKQSDGTEYEVMALKVEIEGYGEYTQNFFAPQSDERPEMAWGISASPLDHFLIIVREILEAVNPQIIKDIDAGKEVLTGNFKQIVNKVAQLTAPYNGIKLQIKLIPQNNGFASMPSFVARITKDGALGIATRIIGQDLTLTPSEKKKIDAAASAKPTNMAEKTQSTADILSDMSEKIDDNGGADGLGSDLPF